LNAERTTMSTTTVRLPDDLKKRLADVAEQAGMTSHALILQAISDRVEADEARNRLYDEADRRYAVIAETGQSRPLVGDAPLPRAPGRRRNHRTTHGPSPVGVRLWHGSRSHKTVAGDLDRIVDHLTQNDASRIGLMPTHSPSMGLITTESRG
jgi:predicted transcriptional regulator